MNKKIPVIIDCDPGHDDMMALVIACLNPVLDVKLVTTVAGNKSIDLVTKNALDVLHYIGADDIPLAEGCEKPMVRQSNHADDKIAEMSRHSESKANGVHGKTGLDGFVFPDDNPKKPISIRAVEAMANILRESDEKITLIATGPLTNLGWLLRCHPELKNKIERISLMGGTSEFVFTRKYMEFNTFMDPEATKIVFECGLPVTMFGYDVTYSVLFDNDVINRIAAHSNQTSYMVSELLKAFMERHNGAFDWLGLTDSCPIHDACAVAGVIDPSLVTDKRMMHVKVETEDGYLCGATICDYTNSLNKPANIEVVYRMDNQRFFDLMEECAARGK